MVFLIISLLIGGLSHLSNNYGFSADNVLSFEVVLANATSVTADKLLHSDLYWALKGGSNNFGMASSRPLFLFHKQTTKYSVYNRDSDSHDLESLPSWEGVGRDYHLQ